MEPSYDLDKIRFASDQSSFEKAVGLYEGGKVKNFQEELDGFSAMVEGGQAYQVDISVRHFNRGNCTCYLGRNDYVCKHMIAVALYAVLRGEKIKEEDKKPAGEVVCSGKSGELGKEELAKVKKEISVAMKYVKAYNGPSRNWFAYQDSLIEGCNRLVEIFSRFPASAQTAELIVKTLLRLDKKLCEGGVDDSDGTVGGFIEQTVGVLEDFYKLDNSCARAFKLLDGKETYFGWEEPLMDISHKMK